MIIYRCAKVGDSGEIAKVHSQTFPRFFLTNLGPRFLERFYRTCVKSNQSVSVLAIDEEIEAVVGFCVGSVSSKGFYKNLILNNLVAYGRQFSVLVFTKPFSLIRLLMNFRKGKAVSDHCDYAEILSLGVIPQKRNLKIGRDLLRKFNSELENRGINHVTLTTDKHSNHRVLKFYERAGFTTLNEFSSYPKRRMLRLVKRL